MATHNVVFEIQVDEETPLAAALTVQEWLNSGDKEWQFYVQNAETRDVVSIDLQEDYDDAVLPVDKYEPLIQNK